MTTSKKTLIKNYNDVPDSLFVIKNYDSLVAESIRALRTNITLRDFDKQLKIINVLSVAEDEGKSTVILNLAASFAQLKKKVLIVDADLHRPSIHRKLMLKNESGLVDVVSDFKTFEESVNHYFEYFDVLTSGTTVPFASEFIQSTALQKFLHKIRDQYDYVFVDCPPIAPISDGLILSKYTDGTLMIIASGESDRKTLKQIKVQFDELQLNVIGIVLNKTLVNNHKYYKNYSSYRNSQR